MCTSDQWWEQLRRRIVSGSRTSCWARCRCRGPNLTQHLCGEEPIWKTPLTSPSSNYDMRLQDNTCFIMQCHNRTGCVDARVKLKKKKITSWNSALKNSELACFDFQFVMDQIHHRMLLTCLSADCDLDQYFFCYQPTSQRSHEISRIGLWNAFTSWDPPSR